MEVLIGGGAVLFFLLSEYPVRLQWILVASLVWSLFRETEKKKQKTFCPSWADILV